MFALVGLHQKWRISIASLQLKSKGHWSFKKNIVVKMIIASSFSFIINNVLFQTYDFIDKITCMALVEICLTTKWVNFVWRVS